MDTVKDNRYKYIGGSDIPTLLNISKFKNREELLQQYLQQQLIDFSSEYALYGTYMEENIRVYANSVLGYNCAPAYTIFEDKRIRCNTDGYDKDANIIFEIKTNNGKHNNTMDYELQMQLYMWAFNANKGYLIQYERPTEFYYGYHSSHTGTEYFNLEFNPDRVSIKEIKRNEFIIKYILNEIEKFWSEIDQLRENLRKDK